MVKNLCDPCVLAIVSKPGYIHHITLFCSQMRLLFHGKLIMKMNELNLLLSASRDPNNTTEKMVIVWERVLLNWTNGMARRLSFGTPTG